MIQRKIFSLFLLFLLSASVFFFWSDTPASKASAWSNGGYSDTYRPDMAGLWTVVASWDGDYDHLDARSPRASFTAEKSESSITCVAAPSTVTAGWSITVFGYLTPSGIGAVTVSLTYTRPDGTVLIREVKTDSWGWYEDTYTPDMAGSWSVVASWSGNYGYLSARSPRASFTVKKFPTFITCVAVPSTITVGESIKIGGTVLSSGTGTVTVSLIFTRPDGTTVTRIVKTASKPRYFEDTYTPDMAGSWSVVASWPGDYVNDGAKSWVVPFVVEKIESSITCSVNPRSITAGSSVTISGSINPAHSTSVTIKISADDGATWNTLASVTTNLLGMYSYGWTPPSSGAYYLKAGWPGDYDHCSAESGVASLKVEKKGSSITCSVSPRSLIVGSTVTVSGSIAPAHSASVTIKIGVDDGATWSTLITIASASDGSYSYSWIPSAVGTYLVKASWAGNNICEPAESSPASFAVEKIQSQISCELSSNSIILGNSVTISGSINPTHSGAGVTIYYKLNDTWNNLATVTTDLSGTYSYNWIPPSSGTCHLKASWPGNSEYHGAESPIVLLSVEKGEGPSITCALSSSTIDEGSSVTISGYASPVGTYSVDLDYRLYGEATWSSITTITSASNGHYSYDWTPEESGRFLVRAIAYPNGERVESQSCSLLVEEEGEEAISFVSMEELFFIDNCFTASFGYGTEANALDTVGGTLVSALFSSHATGGTSVDVLTDDEVTSISEVSGPLISIGGPAVNLFWREYNTPSSWAYFTFSGTEWVIVAGGNEYHKAGNYVYDGGSETEVVTDYATVQLIWDEMNNRPVLLIAGISGHATKSACEWFYNNADNIISEETHAFILEIKNYGNGQWLSTTVVCTV